MRILACFRHCPTRLAALLVAALTLPALSHGAPPPGLLHNGGFERPAAHAQAAGWCAWGGANSIQAFTRVTAGAHSGQACMKLLPTKQYLINGRDDNWLRPKPGVSYRVSFWMRTDLPHPMSFWIGQYKSLAPHWDYAGNIISATLDVGRQWREYSARVPAESITAPLLYLAFQPVAPGDLAALAGKPQAALYLDDVSFAALPAGESDLQTTGPEVVNGATHIAASAQALSEVDPRHTHPADRRVLGIALWRVNGGKYPYSPVYLDDDAQPLRVVVDNLRPLHLASTRVYAVGVEPWPVEETLAKLKHFCDLVGIPTANVVVELENQNAQSILAPSVWGRAAAYSREHKLGFRLWEISNEPYASAWGNTKVYFKTPAAYAAHVIACAKAIHAADPAARVGLSIDSKAPGWGAGLMKRAAGSYDFACPHYYAGQMGFGPAEYYESALTTCWATFAWTRRDRAALAAANPGRHIPIEVTEWAGVGGVKPGVGTDDNPYGTNIIGAIHRAIRQVWYLRGGLVQGAMQWQSHAPTSATTGFAFFFWKKPLGGRTLVWYLSDLLSRHVGDVVLADRLASPMVEIGFERLPVVHSVCTRDTKTGALHWVIVNAAEREAIACRLAIRGSDLTARGTMTTLSQPLTASPVVTDVAAVERKSAVAFAGGRAKLVLPPHSISFVDVK